MIATIDADLVAFRCAASVLDSEEDEQIAHLRCDKLMRDLLANTNASGYFAFLTGSGNFRKKINPEYKANRKDKPPPKWLQSCRAFLIQEWNAKVSDGCEADDLLGIAQTSETILCSLDKDLNMIPGCHYNWLQNTAYVIESFDGIKHFYKQMLIGDRSDNILGIEGIGPVKASKLIDGLTSEQEMFDVVFQKYNDPARFLTNAQCLWIMQKEGETWAHRSEHLILDDQFKLAVEVMLDSMTSLIPDTSMEPTSIPMMTSGIQSNGTPVECMEINEVPLTLSTFQSEPLTNELDGR